MKRIKEYYEKEALELKDHQKRMYFEDPWNIYWHGTRLQEILRMVSGVPFEGFLDVGCAEGYYMKLLPNLAKNIPSDLPLLAGLDIARNYLLKAKKDGHKASWIVGDIHMLPFKANSFDLVLCAEVLEHVLNPERAFDELLRVSKKFLLITLAGENLFYYFAKKSGLLKPGDPYGEVGQGHIHEARIVETIIPWAQKARSSLLESLVTCYFPAAFFQKHRIPPLFIPIVRFADKCINRLPVIKELGAVQIVLLKKRMNLC